MANALQTAMKHLATEYSLKNANLGIHLELHITMRVRVHKIKPFEKENFGNKKVFVLRMR